MEKVAIADENRKRTKIIQTIAITTGICALVWLAFAVFRPDIIAYVARKAHYTVKGGSSPIIVSDGSTIITNNGGTFAIYGSVAALYQPYYRPYSLGYRCPLSANGTPDCSGTTTPCTANNTAACIVNLNNALSWRLFLCEAMQSCADPGSVNIAWKTGNAGDTTTPSIFLITSVDNSRLNLDSPSVLHHLSDANSYLQSALLRVTSSSGGFTSYSFACSQNSTCFSIDYEGK